MRNLKRFTIRAIRRLLEAIGYNLSRKSDYYSPLPTQSDLEKHLARWYRPSSMAGVQYDVDRFKKQLTDLMKKYWDEFSTLSPYSQNQVLGFGPGYTEIDALLLYMMVRELKPRFYLEVGSGLSTYYCSLASERNSKTGDMLQIRCIEPYPYERLYSIRDIKVMKTKAQDVDIDMFLQLQDHDILFIDSSHVVKIDGDVPYLFLEVLPKLRKGVVIHIHDIPFPYNVPYPAEHWVLGQTKDSPYWPMYWNEAMLLQAFLAFNADFEIVMSLPLIRHHDERFLFKAVPIYKPVSEQPNTFSSIWLRKIR